MKLIVQIPCFNEAETLPVVLKGIPSSIAGIDSIETLVIDDGSTDGTSDIARAGGVDHVIRNTKNLGLAFSFRRGLDICLKHGADIIVNIDGDNQYKGSEIPRLIEPLLKKRADIVIGDRQTSSIPHFSPLKKLLQILGSKIVRHMSNTKVQDTVSGFRAFSKDAALRLTILSNYTYTLESILQAQTKGLAIENILIETNPKTRESRLMKNLSSYLTFSGATLIRVFTMYNPLRVFVTIGSSFLVIGSIVGARFVYYYLTVGGAGRVQSLIFASICITVGMTIILVGLLADLIQFNRRLLEDVLERVRRLELDDDRDNK